MKIISPIFDSMRGKLGGCVGAVSRGGVAYLRSRIIPSNPRSLAQSTMRLITTSLAAAWRSTLTGTQRAAWEALASGGESGIDVYVKSNCLNLLARGARLDDAPSSVSLATSPVASVVADASSHNLTTGDVFEANVSGAVFVSRPQSPSRLSQQFNFTYAGHMETGDTALVLPTTHPAYNMATGNVVYVRIVKYGADGGPKAGQVANEQIFRCLVQA